MQLRDLWDNWWPKGSVERSGVPLTDRQRKLTGWLLVLVVGAALLLQITGQRPNSPVMQPRGTIDDFHGDNEPAAGSLSASNLSYGEAVERKLAAILSQVDGVGRVEVMVTLSTGSRLELAQDINGDETVTEEADTQGGKRRVVSQRWNEKVVVVREGQRNSDAPIVLTEHRPVIAGVLVAADGAKDPGIRLLISRAVETAIDIPAHRVTVVPRRE
ncbi:MAG: hypothetical protein GX341_04045 [Firmicutes bacterium]|nr:hypothetical protein [Bacillota bacterium]